MTCEYTAVTYQQPKMTAPITTRKEKKTSFSSNNTEETYVEDDEDDDGEMPTITSTLNPNPRSRNYSTSMSEYSNLQRDLHRRTRKIESFWRLKFMFIIACVINVVLMIGVVGLFGVYIKEILKHIKKNPIPTPTPTPEQTTEQLPPELTTAPLEKIKYTEILNKYLNCSSGLGYCYLTNLASHIEKTIDKEEINKALENCPKRPYIHAKDGTLATTDEQYIIQWNTVEEYYRFGSETPRTDGIFRIPEDGYYFVYTNMHFRVNSDDIEMAGSNISTIYGIHIVQKRKDHTEEFEEVSTSKFQCSLMNQLKHTSSLKRIVKAAKHEELRVVVNYPIIKFDTEKSENHFGIFKLC